MLAGWLAGWRDLPLIHGWASSCASSCCVVALTLFPASATYFGLLCEEGAILAAMLAHSRQLWRKTKPNSKHEAVILLFLLCVECNLWWPELAYYYSCPCMYSCANVLRMLSVFRLDLQRECRSTRHSHRHSNTAEQQKQHCKVARVLHTVLVPMTSMRRCRLREKTASVLQDIDGYSQSVGGDNDSDHKIVIPVLVVMVGAVAVAIVAVAVTVASTV